MPRHSVTVEWSKPRFEDESQLERGEARRGEARRGESSRGEARRVESSRVESSRVESLAFCNSRLTDRYVWL